MLRAIRSRLGVLLPSRATAQGSTQDELGGGDLAGPVSIELGKGVVNVGHARSVEDMQRWRRQWRRRRIVLRRDESELYERRQREEADACREQGAACLSRLLHGEGLNSDVPHAPASFERRCSTPSKGCGETAG